MTTTPTPPGAAAALERRACAAVLHDHCQMLDAHVHSAHQHDELMRTAMWGPIKPTVDNPDHRNEVEGVSYRVGVLYANAQNGGIPSKIRARDIAAITAAITLGTKLFDVLGNAVT